MRKLCVVGAVIVSMLAFAGSAAVADKPAAKTFLAVLNAEEERPTCAPATNAARGVAVFHVTDAAAGTVSFRLVANNLPGSLLAAHIHVAPAGVPGPIVQALPISDAEQGTIGTGTFTNPGLVAAIQEDPDNYYVNVHTDTCMPGVIRGQLSEHGPLSQ